MSSGPGIAVAGLEHRFIRHRGARLDRHRRLAQPPRLEHAGSGRPRKRRGARACREPSRRIDSCIEELCTLLERIGQKVSELRTPQAPHALAEVRAPGLDRRGRAARERGADAARDAVDQHRHALQHHLRQLLHRIEPEQRPARLHHARGGVGLLRRDRRRGSGHARDRLHGRRAVHEPAHPGPDRGRAGARVRGAGADQRHAADAAPRDRGRPAGPQPALRRTARRCASASITTAPTLHETERGDGTWDKAIAGLDWLAGQRLQGRHCRPHLLGRERGRPRAGYARLIARQGWPIDAAGSGPARAAAGDGRPARRAGDHHPLLGHPPQAPRRHDVRHRAAWW